MNHAEVAKETRNVQGELGTPNRPYLPTALYINTVKWVRKRGRKFGIQVFSSSFNNFLKCSKASRSRGST